MFKVIQLAKVGSQDLHPGSTAQLETQLQVLLKKKVLGFEFQICKMKSILKMDGADVCTIRMCLIPMNCTGKVVKIVNFKLCVFHYQRKKS